MRKNLLTKVTSLLTSAVMTIAAGATMAISASANTSEYGFELTSSDALAGKIVNIDLNMKSNNTCEGYTIAVSYDPSLEFVRVNGENGYMATYAEDEPGIVWITGFTAYSFQDGTVASLTFDVPEDAELNEKYDVSILQVKDFGTLEGNFENVTVDNSRINVLEKASSKSMYVVFEDKATGKAEVVKRGDLDGNDNIDIFDVVAVVKVFMNNSKKANAKAMFMADINEDGVVDVFDAIAGAKRTVNGKW